MVVDNEAPSGIPPYHASSLENFVKTWSRLDPLSRYHARIWSRKALKGRNNLWHASSANDKDIDRYLWDRGKFTKQKMKIVTGEFTRAICNMTKNKSFEAFFFSKKVPKKLLAKHHIFFKKMCWKNYWKRKTPPFLFSKPFNLIPELKDKKNSLRKPPCLKIGFYPSLRPYLIGKL